MNHYQEKDLNKFLWNRKDQNNSEKIFFLLYTFFKKGKRDTPDLEGAKNWAVCKKSDGK